MKEKIKVFVSCMTYNQAAYIKEALDGFCAQKTDFPFVCGIIDDASTDGEQAVIGRYLEDSFDLLNTEIFRQEETNNYIRVFAQHKVNKNCFFVVVYLKYNHYQLNKTKNTYVDEWKSSAKYISVCEGDDYWIDPLKLHKQVSFMDSHPNCSLCFTGAKVVFDNNIAAIDIKDYRFLYSSLEERDYEGYELLKNWTIPTASILFRSDVVRRVDERFMFGDIIIALSAVEVGTIHCIPEKMVVYRRNANGLSAKSQPLSRVINHYTAINEVFGNKYRRICYQHIVGSIASNFLTGNKAERKDALLVLQKNPSYFIGVVLAAARICYNVIKKRLSRVSQR